MRARPLLILLCAAASAQTPKPEVDWAAITKQVEALRAAVDARDIERTQKTSSELSHLTTDQWVKQSPTADRLASAEASRRPGDTNSLVYLAMQAVQAGEFDKAQEYAREALQKPLPVYDSVHAGNIVLGIGARGVENRTGLPAEAPVPITSTTIALGDNTEAFRPFAVLKTGSNGVK
jgi:hypothetical protein